MLQLLLTRVMTIFHCMHLLRQLQVKDGVNTECNCSAFGIPMPAQGQVFDFMFDFEQNRYEGPEVLALPKTSPR
jgi:hypothetical protein